MTTIKSTVNVKPPWLRFGLRTLMIIVTMLSVVLGMLLYGVNRRRRNVAIIESLGGIVCYEYEELGGATFGYVQPGPPFWRKYQSAEPPGPRWLRNMLGDDFFARVTYVHAASSQMTDSHFIHISEFSDVVGLDLGDTLVTDAFLAHVGSFPHLAQLHLDDTDVTDDGLRHLQRLPSLQDLSLSGKRITDAGVKCLATIPNLQSLSLQDTSITDESIIYLKRLRRLTHVNLMGTIDLCLAKYTHHNFSSAQRKNDRNRV